jgi:hypothetical protein
MLYGGIGTLLQMGPAPAAGVAMVGLSDDAGEPLAEWARRRSPRFYRFAAGLVEQVGLAQYVGTPVLAEAYARAPRMRPSLSTPLVAAMGRDGAEQIHSVAEMYDEATRQRAEQAAEAHPFPTPAEPTPE